MGAVITIILDFLARILQKEYLIELAKWLAWKIVIVTLFFTGGWILYTIIVSRTWDIAMRIIQERVSSGSTVVSIAGIAGYILTKFHFPQIFSLMLSALSIKVALRMIPFSPVR